MRRPPRPPARDVGLLQAGDWTRPLALGIVFSAAVITLYLWSLQQGASVETARALALTTMLLGQLSLVLTERAPDRPLWRADWGSNKMLGPILGP